jgi:hypothetical protein
MCYHAYTLFDTEKSTSFIDYDIYSGYGLPFLDGEVWGYWTYDNISLDGLGTTLEEYFFISVNETHGMAEFPADGVVGLDLSAPLGDKWMSKYNLVAFLYQEHAIDEPLFSIQF